MHPVPARLASELRNATLESGLAILVLGTIGWFAVQRIEDLRNRKPEGENLASGTEEGSEEIVAFVEGVLRDYQRAEQGDGAEVWASVLASRPRGDPREWIDRWGPGLQWAEFFDRAVEEGWEDHWELRAAPISRLRSSGWEVFVERGGGLPGYTLTIRNSADGYLFSGLVVPPPR